MTRYIKLLKSMVIEQLYVKITCPFCDRQYSFHIRKPKQPRVCPCARGTFYFSLEPYKNYIGIHVLWIGPWQQEVSLEVDSIEVAKIEDIPMFKRDEIDEEMKDN